MVFAYALTYRGTSYLAMIDNDIGNIINNFQNNKQYDINYDVEILKVFLDKEIFLDCKDTLLEIDHNNDENDINTELQKLIEEYKGKVGNMPEKVWIYRNENVCVYRDCEIPYYSGLIVTAEPKIKNVSSKPPYLLGTSRNF